MPGMTALAASWHTTTDQPGHPSPGYGSPKRVSSQPDSRRKSFRLHPLRQRLWKPGETRRLFGAGRRVPSDRSRAKDRNSLLRCVRRSWRSTKNHQLAPGQPSRGEALCRKHPSRQRSVCRPRQKIEQSQPQPKPTQTLSRSRQSNSRRWFRCWRHYTELRSRSCMEVPDHADGES